MKKILYSVLSLIVLTTVLTTFTSCEKEYDDLMTSNVQLGGLIDPLASFPYKLNATPTVPVAVNVEKGPGIKEIEVYRSYTGIDKEIQDPSIDIAQANAAGDVEKVLTYDYAKLADGLGLPADEGDLNIGDAWTLRYVSVMEDGRKVTIGATTTISVANFFAGDYLADIQYFHPSVGYDEPYSAEVNDKTLTAISATTCKTWFAVWSDNECYIEVDGEDVIFTVWEDWGYDVIMGHPDFPDADEYKCTYDTETGDIMLHYYYVGSENTYGVHRIFHEAFTLAP